MSVSGIVFHLQSLPSIGDMNIASIVTEATKYVQSMPNLSTDERKRLLLEAFERVAAGKDGVLGTADDIFSAEVIAKVRVLLENKILGEVLDLASNIQLPSGMTGCFGCFGAK